MKNKQAEMITLSQPVPALLPADDGGIDRRASTAFVKRPINNSKYKPSFCRSSLLSKSFDSAANAHAEKKAGKDVFTRTSKTLASSRLENQRVVTFYRSSSSTQPDLRMVINTNKYTNLDTLVAELTRALSLEESEQQIFKFNGNRIKEIREFEDGASYFFAVSKINGEGPRALTLMKETSETMKTGSRNARRESRSLDRIIKVITSENRANVWTVLVNETNLKTFTQLLSELNRIIQPEEGRVARLCNSKGRRVCSLAELFHGTDTVVAIISSIGMDKPLEDKNFADDREMNKVNQRKKRLHRPSKYDIIKGEDSHLERKLITVQGKTHIFDAPSNKLSYQALRHRLDKLPEQKLQLQWIYGYNGQESRDNVHVLKSEELIYYAASVVVIYDVCRHKQRYYTQHTTQITCMALHPNRWYVATGQAAPENSNIGVLDHIRIWNADYLNTLAVLSLEEQTLSVSCLTFSLEDNGRKLGSIDTDGHNYRLIVWDWNARKILAKSQSYEEKEFALKFHPHSNKSLLSAGKDHVFYWTWRGNLLEKYKGHIFGCEIPEYINCLVYLSNGDAVTGDSNGNLQFWGEGSRKTKRVIKNAHKGGIQSLYVLSHDILLSYGSEDTTLSLWETREESKDPTATTEVYGDHGDITSVAVSPQHHDYSVGNIEFFLGTAKNRILKGTFKTEFHPLIKGHAIETTAMASNPCENQVVTAGLDGYVIYRSADTHSITWENNLKQPATALGFYPYGNVFAVGTSSGKWSILASKDGQHIASFQSGMTSISCISYSSDGADVAIGTALGEIHLFSVYDEGHSYRLVATVQGNAGKITAIDWSKEGMYFRTLTDNFEQNVWNMEQLSEISDLKVISSIDWQMQKSTLSYNTAGIWKPGSDLLMSCCDRLATRDLLCVGTEYGHIRLFSYPCSSVKNHYREYLTHVSNVNHVQFLTSQVNLVSSGQFDNTIMQWRIVFGDFHEQGIKTGLFERAQVDRDASKMGEFLPNRAKTLGHRRVRSSEPSLNLSTRNPYSRSSSVSPRPASIENLDDNYPSKPIKLDRSELNLHMKTNGGGTYKHFVSLQKSESYLKEYNVTRPVSKERSRKRSEEGTLPKLGSF